MGFSGWMMVEFLHALPGLGEVSVVAAVLPGRAPPLACSEASYLDPGDPGEADVLEVRRLSIDDEAWMDVLPALETSQLIELEAAALERAAEMGGGDR